MSDDQREREPLRDQLDNPPEDGVRSDIGGSSSGTEPLAPGGDAVRRVGDRAERDGEAPSRDPLADVQHPTADE